MVHMVSTLPLGQFEHLQPYAVGPKLPTKPRSKKDPDKVARTESSWLSIGRLSGSAPWLPVSRRRTRSRALVGRSSETTSRAAPRHPGGGQSLFFKGFTQSFCSGGVLRQFEGPLDNFQLFSDSFIGDLVTHCE